VVSTFMKVVSRSSQVLLFFTREGELHQVLVHGFRIRMILIPRGDLIDFVRRQLIRERCTEPTLTINTFICRTDHKKRKENLVQSNDASVCQKRKRYTKHCAAGLLSLCICGAKIGGKRQERLGYLVDGTSDPRFIRDISTSEKVSEKCESKNTCYEDTVHAVDGERARAVNQG